MSERGSAVNRFKSKRRHDQRVACDACGWKPPIATRPGRRPIEMLMHGHHVVPIAFGGRDHESNLVLLCPNCHALAHALTAADVDPRTIGLPWGGSATPQHLIHLLRSLYAEPMFEFADAV